MEQFLQIHALAVETGRTATLLLFKLLRLSSSLGSLIRFPDVYHYTALIAAYIALTSRHDALRLYSQMESQLLLPDTVVISYIFKACALSSSLSEGRQLHRQAIKLDLACERPVEMMLAS
ncbi:putative pentatricopeptide repeat-containing protein At5g59200, chloroplastic [Curcuma longa]|uniref:putative pentatricopeptide repeat-containing protein At5g59200, chloroplastic n=1 Tax=Curcuma longa TaxID=136217 RepID=UPI003D9DDBD6